MRAFLQHVGGGEIDRDAARRQGEPHGGKRRAHPFPGFGDRLVRQADNVERDHARRQLHLAVDVEHVDAVKGDGVNAGNHAVAAVVRLAGGVRRIRGCGNGVASMCGLCKSVHVLFPVVYGNITGTNGPRKPETARERSGNHRETIGKPSDFFTESRPPGAQNNHNPLLLL